MSDIQLIESNEKPLLEFGAVIKNPVYKSEMIIGSLTIRFEKRFNWLNRLMFKVFFGLTIKNIEEEK